MFPTTSLDVPHVFRSFLFRKVDLTTNPCPLIGEFSFTVSFLTQKVPRLGNPLILNMSDCLGDDYSEDAAREES